MKQEIVISIVVPEGFTTEEALKICNAVHDTVSEKIKEDYPGAWLVDVEPLPLNKTALYS